MRGLKRRDFLHATSASLIPSLARAQGYPTRQVRAVVAYPAGGGTDFVARLVMPKLAERWGQTIIIDNRGGASGILGSDIVAKAPPDGYTLLVTTSAHTINPFTTKKLPYDTETDFTPVTVLVKGALALVGSPKAGFSTIEKYIAAARANPGKYQFGSTESTSRMVGELFRLKSELVIENVAYKGGAPMMQDLMGGHLPAGFTSPLTVMTHHKNGTLPILAVTSEKRLAVLPEVPTMADAGVQEVNLPAWFGLFGPRGMPPEIVHRIQEDVVAVLREPEVLTKIRNVASEPGGESADAFTKRIKDELVVWRETARAAGIEPE